MRKPEDFLSRGTGNFINCTDYDDAIQAMSDFANQQTAALKKEVEELKGLFQESKRLLKAVENNSFEQHSEIARLRRALEGIKKQTRKNGDLTGHLHDMAEKALQNKPG